ncbi:MAG: mucoidy inhibitor MuiA family protein [Candidatus Thorarchaeota archaeon]
MTVEMKTNITNVTVFRDGARVTRSGKEQLIPGEQEVIIAGLSYLAQDDSFRVKGRGAAALKGIDVKQKTQTFEPEGDLGALIEEFERLQKERQIITDKIEQQNSRLSLLSSISQQFSTEFGKWYAAGESGMEQLDEMDKTSLKLVSDAKKKTRKLHDNLEEIDAKIQVVQTNIQRMRGHRRTETTKEVKAMLDVKENTEIELEITYQLGASGWAPTYDVDIGEGTANVKRIAMVHNGTLEDWVDVELVVSTASARRVEAVEATPFYIDVYSHAIGRGISGVASKGGYAEGAADMDDGLELYAVEEAPIPEPVPEMIETYATASETLSGTIIYDVPGRVTMPAGEEPQPITLTEESFEAKRLYYWNAYAMPEVVAQDEITNGDSVMLPGNVRVYAKGDFLGETHIGLKAPRETFRLGTRTAYDAKAEKKLVEKDTEKAGLTRGKRRRGYRYQLEIKSFSKEPLDIRIVDRIPHSNSEKIEVEFKPLDIPPKKNEMGVLEWEVKIEAQKELTIKYAFEVEWVRDLTIRPPLP